MSSSKILQGDIAQLRGGRVTVLRLSGIRVTAYIGRASDPTARSLLVCANTWFLIYNKLDQLYPRGKERDVSCYPAGLARNG